MMWLFCLIGSASAAEPEDPRPGAPPLALSIEDALRRAQLASEPVAIASAERSGALGDRWSARSGFFPQIGASLVYQRTFETEFDDLFSPSALGGTGGFGQTPTGQTPTDTTPTDTTPTDTTPTGTTPTTPTGTGDGGGGTLPFGQPNTWRATIQVDQLVFGGGRNFALNRIAEAAVRSADVQVESARAAAALDTASAYFDAVLTDQLLEIATSTLAQTEATARQTELGSDVGRQPEFDLLRARVAVENQQVSVIGARRQRDLAHWRLSQLLDLPPDQPLALTTPLDPETVASEGGVADVAADVSGAAAPGQVRAPVRQLREAATIAQSNVAVARADALPTLAASLSLGWVSFPTDVIPFGDGAQWYASSNGSVALSVPVFNGFRVYGGLRRARADAIRTAVQLEQTEELASLDTASARNDLDAADAQWQATEGAVEQARRAYEIAELRFAEGVSTQLELTDARLQLERAMVNRAQAGRDLAVARIRLALIASLPLTGP